MTSPRLASRATECIAGCAARDSLAPAGRAGAPGDYGGTTMTHSDELSFDVEGLPPAKNEALSLFAQDHAYADRVLTLLLAARQAIASAANHRPLGSKPIALDVTLTSPTAPPSDATNYLGGIADVLENKDHRGTVDQLGPLKDVALYDNDRQIREVHYRWVRRTPTHYTVTLWAICQDDSTD